MKLNYDEVIAEIASMHVPPEDAFTIEQFVDDTNRKIKELHPDRDVPPYTLDAGRRDIKQMVKDGVMECCGKFTVGGGTPPHYYRFKS